MHAIKLESCILSFVKAPIARAWPLKAFSRFEDWFKHASDSNVGQGQACLEREEDHCYIEIMQESGEVSSTYV